MIRYSVQFRPVDSRPVILADAVTRQTARRILAAKLRRAEADCQSVERLDSNRWEISWPATPYALGELDGILSIRTTH